MTTESSPRPTVAVVTDSATGLSRAMAESLSVGGGFVRVPLPLMVGDQIFTEIDDPGVNEKLVVASAEGRRMTTSRPSPGAFATAYESLAKEGYEHIVSVHLSSELSGTVDAARASARGAAATVSVIDTRTVAMAEGMAVIAALDAARAGGGPAEVEAAAGNAARRARLLFYVPTLEALARSGRIPKSLAIVGQMFQIRPIATVAQGRLKYLERPRQEASAVKRLGELVAADARQALEEDRTTVGESGRVVVAIQDFYGSSLADHLSDVVAKEFGGDAIIQRSTVPPVLAVHAGLGPVSVVCEPASLVHGLTSTGA
ncbi:DegV family protein [Kocuria massiliensis]|uniref:DegV family protein n=1 Tax=Kocuria massiliensis TaxID=1926282 RepID=UPI0022B9BBD8|nr:DegV family protein [Kocuria massiliensis]